MIFKWNFIDEYKTQIAKVIEEKKHSYLQWNRVKIKLCVWLHAVIAEEILEFNASHLTTVFERLSLYSFHSSYLIYEKQAGNSIVLVHNFILIANIWHDILNSAKFKQR